MKPLLSALACLLLASALGAEEPKPVDQSSPVSVLEAIFEAARTGELERLAPLAASDADGDVEQVCGVAKAPEEVRRSFREAFAKGRIRGEPRIEGDRAAIDFLFGPDGTKEETMNLIREDGKWFLGSF